MTDLPGIVITGASGRMGQMLINTVMGSDKCKLVGAVERTGHDWVGRDVGEAMGGLANGVIVTDDALEAFSHAQAVIDFTAPAATVAFSTLAAQAHCVHVIGTTGMTDDDIAKLGAAAHHCTIVRAGNMSLGVNLLTKLTKMVSEALGEAAAEGRGVKLADVSDSGRDGITGARTRGDIGFSAIRGGDIVGEHDVMFLGDGERIILRHVASDRSLFAKGALKAALWGQTQKPGEYDMMDVLGL